MGAPRLLLTGSRTWADGSEGWHSLGDYALTWRVLRACYAPGVTPVTGACPAGARIWWGETIWRSFGGWVEPPHPADWVTHGKAAGYRRNAHMVALDADKCVAFISATGPGGATHTARLAEQAGNPYPQI